MVLLIGTMTLAGVIKMTISKTSKITSIIPVCEEIFDFDNRTTDTLKNVYQLSLYIHILALKEQHPLP